jgi:hypothetical protein
MSVVYYSESGFIALKDLGGGGWGNTRKLIRLGNL